jgi:hypothetical protein
VRFNADLSGFLESAKTTANARAVKEWSSSDTRIEDTGWSKLADRLNLIG